jgi:hypothetical protein
MDPQLTNAFWKPSFEVLYQCYFQELASSELINRLRTIDKWTGLVVAMTASGSMFAGLGFWGTAIGEYVWGSIALLVSCASTYHAVFEVRDRVKEEDQSCRNFRELRVDIQNFRRKLRTGTLNTQQLANEEFTKLSERFSQCMAGARGGLAYGLKLRTRVQDLLDELLRVQGETQT